MTNKTQCPNCERIYQITNEQYERSQGKVRCSNCGERFRSTFLSEPAGVLDDTHIQYSTEHSFTDSESSSAFNSQTNTNQSDLFDSDQHDIEFNSNDKSSNLLIKSGDLHTNHKSKEKDVSALFNNVGEINSLAEPVEDSALLTDELFTTKNKTTLTMMFFKGLIAVALMASSVLLAISIAYQFWLKQYIDWPVLEQISPYAQQLNKKFAKQIIDHNNVSFIQLVSAQTKPHPTRASTTLLNFSLLNHSKHHQEMPNIELSLTDKDGRIVSRRSLSAEDYLYNNNTSNTLAKKELKSTTVELLNFPKHVIGYQLRIVKNTRLVTPKAPSTNKIN